MSEIWIQNCLLDRDKSRQKSGRAVPNIANFLPTSTKQHVKYNFGFCRHKKMCHLMSYSDTLNSSACKTQSDTKLDAFIAI